MGCGRGGEQPGDSASEGVHPLDTAASVHLRRPPPSALSCGGAVLMPILLVVGEVKVAAPPLPISPPSYFVWAEAFQVNHLETATTRAAPR
jgi:hypothetical protein